MYLNHFKLKKPPFSLIPDIDFFCPLSPHVEALQVVKTALQTGEGFINIIGEKGTGKTLLCRQLIKELPENFHCVCISNPHLTPQQLRRTFASGLGLTVTSANVSEQQLSIQIQQQLLALSFFNRIIVIILDNAHILPDETLEALRLFTNLETETKKLLQVVFFARPELNNKLKQNKFRQLKQRITFNYVIRTLTYSESCEYISHRLITAGSKSSKPISSVVSIKVAKESKGIPSLINIMAHNALLLSYAENMCKVKIQHVNFVKNNIHKALNIYSQSWRLWLAGAFCILFFIGSLWGFL